MMPFNNILPSICRSPKQSLSLKSCGQNLIAAAVRVLTAVVAALAAMVVVVVQQQQ
jgi:hypothetical protein